MKDHNRCQDLLAHLSEYIDGDLENQQLCEEIQSHLDGCENCRIMVDTLKKTIFLYHASADSAGMPEDVRERLFQKLDLEAYLD